ncbi:MAG: hypothetical protein C3F11_09665 [Methylocystaceae bacterium]|nr:MAG: hypothetical protein C3F11_09665 [Methylocystaceae bacterium]
MPEILQHAEQIVLQSFSLHYYVMQVYFESARRPLRVLRPSPSLGGRRADTTPDRAEIIMEFAAANATKDGAPGRKDDLFDRRVRGAFGFVAGRIEGSAHSAGLGRERALLDPAAVERALRPGARPCGRSSRHARRAARR